MDPNSQTKCARYLALDSLRGLAAMSVVAFHLLLLSPNYSWHLVFRSPLALVTMGPEAVRLFFVLSGFVLALQITRGGLSAAQYFAQRICRIYLPYLAAVFSAIVCALALGHAVPAWAPKFMHGYWNEPLSAQTLKAVFFFIIPSPKLMHLDPVIWSLVYEMRISLIFPLVIAACRKFGSTATLAAGALFAGGLAVANMHNPNFYQAAAFEVTWLPTLHYLFLFIIGAALALNKESVLNAIRGNTTFVLLASVAGYFGNGLIADHLPLHEFMHDTMQAISVCGIMACALSGGRFARALKIPALTFIGRISYSLYLFHFIVVIALVHALGAHASYLLTTVLTGVLSIPVAYLGYRYVEVPSIKLGRTLSRKIGDWSKPFPGRTHAGIATPFEGRLPSPRS